MKQVKANMEPSISRRRSVGATGTPHYSSRQVRACANDGVAVQSQGKDKGKVDIHYPENRFSLCAPPDPCPQAPTRFEVPQGAVDTHAHIIGPPPYVENRMYTPPEATPEAYLSMLDAVRMAYGVLIQISVHGYDNSFMVDCLKKHPGRLRGIVMVPDDLPEQGWRQLVDAGVTGIRLNAVAAGGIKNLDGYEAICRELGWHLQFVTTAAQLSELAPLVGKLQVPSVIDHMGHFSISDGANIESRKLMVNLVRDGAWVKLSGAFRISTHPPYADTASYARELIEAGPDRCVWGSDWPHIAFTGSMLNVGNLLDLLPDWAPDPAMRDRILVHNAQRLYGFPSAAQGKTR